MEYCRTKFGRIKLGRTKLGRIKKAPEGPRRVARGVSPWKGCRTRFQSPGGATSIPEILLIECDSMPLQQRDIFFLKRLLMVMRFLGSNVIRHGWNLRFANRKRAVSFLPTELSHLHFGFIRPFRRIRLDARQHLRHGYRWFEFRQYMDVVADSSNFQQYPAFTANDSTDVTVKLLLPIGCYERNATFCAEDKVIQ